MKHHFGYLPGRRWCPSCQDAVLVVDPRMTVDEFPHCGGCGSMITLPLPAPKADPIPTGIYTTVRSLVSELVPPNEGTTMTAYLVRLKTDRKLVGLFVAEDPKDLWTYVDEYCDVSACEYQDLFGGGMYYGKAGAPSVPTVREDHPEAREKMPDWFSGATMTDDWAILFETNLGEKRWKDCPA